MHYPRPVRENMRFLIAEVASQISHIQKYIDTASVSATQRVLERAGYAYNLKNRIHNTCIKLLSNKDSTEAERFSIRAIEFIATDLEKITELGRDCIKQMLHLRNDRLLHKKIYCLFMIEIRKGLDLIEPAIIESDTPLALKIGSVEDRLDYGYQKLFRQYTRKLKKGGDTEDLLQLMFIARNIEQMGDAMLNISESILSANLGQAINTERYYALQETVAEFSQVKGNSTMEIEPIAETRSGSGISGVKKAGGQQGYAAIYKDGDRKKLNEERKGVKSWHQIYPGVAPKILAYQKRRQTASLLIEHLDGITFEHLLLHESPELLQHGLKTLTETLASIWNKTRTNNSVSAGYVAQMEKRLGDVYEIHPEFKQGSGFINELEMSSFAYLLKQAAAFEKQYQAPFSVYIHGDFNLDNILFDPQRSRVKFIDLHRSQYFDYVQDVTVFMVSIYRLQILDPIVRKRMMKLARDFCHYARRYARRSGDKTFEIRLTLGLARSFATSTRFILDKSLAQKMFLRARYLIEQILVVDPQKAEKYRTPVKELFIG